MERYQFSRRAFLKSAGLGGALLLGSRLDALAGRAPISRAARFAQMGDPFVPDAVVDITAGPKDVPILSGAQTHVWSYTGQLLQGTGMTVTNLPDRYLGPILRVKSGTKVRINFHNQLGEDSVIHPHGLHVPQDCDGHPMLAIHTNETKIYDFQVIDRAGPYWFHPHPMGRTAEQVVAGLAGLFTVWDDEEKLAVPWADTGEYDIPVIIQDRNFDSSNQFLYNPNQLWGYLGNKVLVNGQPNPALSLEPRPYRLRFLNGSNARTYKLAWSNAMALRVIGTDGGLLPAAVSKSYVVLMPGERVDVWADLSSLGGKQVMLRSLSFSAGGMGGMGGMGSISDGKTADAMVSEGADSATVDGMCGGCGGGGGGGGGGMMGSGLANGAAFNILTINVASGKGVKLALGPLPAIQRFTPGDISNYANPRQFTLEMGRMMTWTINHRVFEMTAVAEDEMVNLGDTEVWEWINNSSIPHPMHIHNVQFQVIKRTPPSSTTGYNTISQGLVDTGWKDTVLVYPGERVKVAMKFSPYTGMYMYHCHILEHEDMTMMRNYMIMGEMPAS